MALVALGIAWLVLGAVTAVVMIRRGHDVTTWVLLALLLGPVVPIAAVGAVRAERLATPVVVHAGDAGAGPIDVVAAIDGSPESTAALRAAVDLHRGALGRVYLAVVVPHDTDPDPEVALALAAAARSVDAVHPTTVVLHGEPVAALRRFAVDERCELIVVGARGRGRAASPLGSVAARLAAGAPVPVLVGPAP